MPKLNFPQGDPISASFTAGQQRHQRRTGASGSWGGDDYSDPTVGDVALTGANALTGMAGADPQSLIGSLGSYLGINGDDEQAGQQGQGQQESWNPLAGLWTGLAGPVHAAIQNRPATKQERLNQLSAGVQSVMLAGGAAEGAEALRGRMQPSIQPPPQPEFSAPTRLRAPLDEGAAVLEHVIPPPPSLPTNWRSLPPEHLANLIDDGYESGVPQSHIEDMEQHLQTITHEFEPQNISEDELGQNAAQEGISQQEAMLHSLSGVLRNQPQLLSMTPEQAVNALRELNAPQLGGVYSGQDILDQLRGSVLDPEGAGYDVHQYATTGPISDVEIMAAAQDAVNRAADLKSRYPAEPNPNEVQRVQQRIEELKAKQAAGEIAPAQPPAPAAKPAKPAKPPAPIAPEPVREPGKWYYDNINESLKSWQPKGTADQLLAHLKKSKGALEEADTIGLTDWLKEQPKSVSREDVQRFLDQNKIDVQEVQHGGGETKYASYQEPGGENYRELLLTKPSATQADGGSYHSSHWNEPNILAHIRMNDRTLPDGRKALFIEEVQSDWHQQGRKKAYTNPGDIKAADDALHIAQHNINNFREAYAQWHNDRVMSDPAKRARLEQLQAQHSAARDAFDAVDYDMPNAPYEELRRQALNAESQLNTFKHGVGGIDPYSVNPNHFDSVLSNADPTTPYGTDIRQWSQKYHELQDAYSKASDRANAVRDGVPDAPFKGDGWKKLALKRILTYAADNGYDGVGWTPGSVQGKRYNLSQHVNSIEWHSGTPDDLRRAVHIKTPNEDIALLLDKDGKVVRAPYGHDQFNGKGLDELIGKDVAAKIMQDEHGKLSGEGLDIGGEGMKGFYDKELPNLMNDIMKKHGQKATRIDIGHNGNKPFVVFDSVTGRNIAHVASETEAVQYIRDHPELHGLDYDSADSTGNGAAPGHIAGAHYIDLPPAVRRKISSTGMPLFIGAGAATGLATLANSANSANNGARANNTKNSAPQSPAPHDPITQSFLAGRANLKSPD